MKACLGLIFVSLFSRIKIKRRNSKFFNQFNFPLGKPIKLKAILQIPRGKRKLYIDKTLFIDKTNTNNPGCAKT